jgi:hypothetical protein
MKICASFLAVALLSGCAQESPGTAHPPPHAGKGLLVPKGFVAGQGDVGRFIMQTAVHFGKKPPVAKELPLVSDQWRYTRFHGSHAIAIELSSEKYADVKSYLDEFFGPPGFGRDGGDGIYIYGLTKPVQGGSLSVSIVNVDGHDITEIAIDPP